MTARGGQRRKGRAAASTTFPAKILPLDDFKLLKKKGQGRLRLHQQPQGPRALYAYSNNTEWVRCTGSGTGIIAKPIGLD